MFLWFLISNEIFLFLLHNNDFTIELNTNIMFIKTSFYQQSDSDGDEDCSCSSCECPNCLSVNNNHPSITDQQRSSPADLNSIYQRIDQSYSKLPSISSKIINLFSIDSI
jgi:hypothetical protein